MDISVLSLLVAALAVFIGPIVSWKIAKRQIAASFAPMKQAWINNLRDLLAQLTSDALHYYASGFEDRTVTEYRDIGLLESKVQLMLNPQEEEHKRLEGLIRKMIAAIHHDKKKDDFPELHDRVVELSREILRKEWDRVKASF